MPKAKNLPTRRKLTPAKPTPAARQEPSQPAGPPIDPIWAAIEKHRQERAAYEKACREKWPGDIDIPEDAMDGMYAAAHPLLTTRPTTLAGAIAVLRYVRAQEDKNDCDDAQCPTFLLAEVDGVFWAHAFLETIADALSSGLSKIVAVTGDRAEG